MLIGTRMRSSEWRYLRWPWLTPNYPKPPHFPHFVSPFIFSQWVEIETSNLVGRRRLFVAIIVIGWRIIPEMGVVSRSREQFWFSGSPIISLKRLKLETSNFVHMWCRSCITIGVTCYTANSCGYEYDHLTHSLNFRFPVISLESMTIGTSNFIFSCLILRILLHVR